MQNPKVNENVINQIFHDLSNGEKFLKVVVPEHVKIEDQSTASFAFSHSPESLKFFSDELKKDEDFILELLANFLNKPNCKHVNVKPLLGLIGKELIKTPSFWARFCLLPAITDEKELYQLAKLYLDKFDTNTYLEFMELFMNNNQDFPYHIIPQDKLNQPDFTKQAILLDGNMVKLLPNEQLSQVDFLWQIWGLSPSKYNNEQRLSFINEQMLLETLTQFCLLGVAALGGFLIANAVIYSLPIVFAMGSAMAAACLVGFGVKTADHVHGFFSLRPENKTKEEMAFKNI